MGKSDLVINVLKNFIYIEGQYEGYPHNTLPETQSADYRNPYLHADIRDQPDLVGFSTEGPDVSVSGDVIGLTFGGVGCEDFCSIADMVPSHVLALRLVRQQFSAVMLSMGLLEVREVQNGEVN